MWISLWSESYPLSSPVICSEILDIISEYRVYCVFGQVKGVSKYGKESSLDIALDMDVVLKVSKILFESDESLDGCAIDFGIVKKDDGYATILVEVNDGIFTGYYEGVTKKDFSEMFLARWWQILKISENHSEIKV